MINHLSAQQTYQRINNSSQPAKNATTRDEIDSQNLLQSSNSIGKDNKKAETKDTRHLNYQDKVTLSPKIEKLEQLSSQFDIKNMSEKEFLSLPTDIFDSSLFQQTKMQANKNKMLEFHHLNDKPPFDAIEDLEKLRMEYEQRGTPYTTVRSLDKMLNFIKNLDAAQSSS